MIINKNNFYEIRNGTLTKKNKSNLFKTLDKLHGRFWYVEIADIHCFADELIDVAIPPHILYLIQNSNLHLMLVNYLEGFHIIVDVIYDRLVNHKNIPANKITFFSESHNIYDTIKLVAKRNNLPELKTYYLRITENSVANQEFHQIKKISSKNIKKKFLNFNRRWRPHRPTLVSLLYATNLLKEGYVSLPKTLYGSDFENSFDLLCYLNRHNENISELLCNNKEKIKQLPELVIDRNDFENNGPLAKHLPNLVNYYNETMFSVVSETNFYTEFNKEYSVFITEKTYKTIAYKHPFVLVSSYKSLRALRNLGYKTFSPFINEDYDEIENDSYRMFVILKEIERLCNLSKKQMDEFVIGCSEITEYNYNLLVSRTDLDKCLLPLN